jgi:glycosyltransferase involved in cell wall biosynthesis
LAVIPALVEPRGGFSRREALGLPEEAVLFGSFGQVTAEKQIEMALEAFSRVREVYPQCHYLLVGEVMPDVGHRLEQIVHELALAGFVHQTGFSPGIDEFVDWLQTVDVVVNLRHPTVGETSATALRALAAAKPLIVFDHGWYSEIPDEMAIKVAPLDPAGLLAAMTRLAGSAELRRVMGQAGQVYTRNNCHPEKVAAGYLKFLRDSLERLGSIPA